MKTIAAPVDWVQSIAEFRFPPSLDQRLQELMDRNNDGLLSEQEYADLASLVELSQEIALLRAPAMRLLSNIVNAE